MKEKTIILLGAKGLIGSNIADSLNENGENLVSVDLNIKEFESDHSLGIKGDITDEKSLNRIISRTEKKFGKIDSLINCSYPKNTSFGKTNYEITYKNFCENINLHLGGFFLSTKIFFEYFKKNKKGSILNFASIYGSISPRFKIYEKTDIKLPIEYAVSKSGIIHLTKYFAACSKDLSININSISPGGVEDDQPRSFKEKYKSLSLNKGLLKAEEMNELVIFLLSDGARSINGQNIIIDDGFSL
jgi:NAD(P)-dependent dehydrogenase (short-subunit alcohol dehydrogenase family)